MFDFPITFLNGLVSNKFIIFDHQLVDELFINASPTNHNKSVFFFIIIITRKKSKKKLQAKFAHISFESIHIQFNRCFVPRFFKKSIITVIFKFFSIESVCRVCVIVVAIFAHPMLNFKTKQKNPKKIHTNLIDTFIY